MGLFWQVANLESFDLRSSEEMDIPMSLITKTDGGHSRREKYGSGGQLSTGNGGEERRRRVHKVASEVGAEVPL